MKIAFLSFYSGCIYRGVETFVHELANRLAKKGHDVVVYQNGPPLVDATYKTVSIGVPADWTRRKTYIALVDYWHLRVKEFTAQVLKRLDAGTEILIPTNGQWSSWLCRSWARQRKMKLVISGQTGPTLDDMFNLAIRPDAYVALTAFGKRWAEKINPRVRVEWIPNGVALQDFHPETSPLDFGLAHPVILYVGAFDFGKRVDLIIKAVGQLEHATLLLVGKGSEVKLKKLAERRLPNRYAIRSFPYQQMPQVYAAADLFTFVPISSESFGLVLVEAMASGLPIVATDDPIRREIVGDAGLFVNPTDTRAYAATLALALNRQWGDKPRHRAENFCWDKITSQYEELFQDLA